ncbi:hypothetical protein EIP91_009678 [Steccherinum ochraceum]|uniref:Uncharacterized protein n=1 Tax=Steccherinum ochraceum TaxID=92696 RepID=A0A4R0RK29_9APHY|nr:hypothetical protein EIP91_009678 [Steccherinum ochraceum]
MQDPSKNYAISHYDAPVWADWMRPSRSDNPSWDSSIVASLTNDSDDVSDVIEGSTPETAIPVGYTWTPSTPTLDSDHSSSSQLSIESPSLSELDELPEIPFISSAEILETDNDADVDDDDEEQYDFDNVGNSVDERTFWANIIRPNLSRSSGGRPAAVLGQTNQRVISGNRCRSPSVSSTTSSRSKPPPAKSILSSSNSSIRTCKGRKPPSVKFLDAPTVTIRYDSEAEDDDEDEDDDEPYSSAAKHQGAQTGILGFFRRMVGAPLKKSRAPERPVISGPIPLWEGSRRRARLSLDETGKVGRSPSLRTNRSTPSLRSVRSSSSRLQTYWGRVTGKDP